MSSFDALGLEPSLVAALRANGIESPFPVQEATLPDAIAGRDVCAKAPTGSGKTLAYGLALLQRCTKARPRAPKALILVPTRELAKQVADVLTPYAREQRRWVTAFFGGAAMMQQIGDLQRGVDIAVATPGRLTDLVNRGECDLSDVELIVIDEADRMADMGFTPQVTWLLDLCAPTRQTLLYSATLDGDVDQIVKQYMTDPQYHAIAGPDGEEDDDAVLKRAKHLTVPTRHDSKFQDLAFLVDAAGRAIVFVKNRFATERTAEALDDLGVRAVAMHGGMTQSARERALERWADGAFKALVATDVAARGVHVHGVELVVHVDPPQDEKDYIHRSGRTARAGLNGSVVSMLRKEQQRTSAAMFRRLGVEVTPATAEEVRELVAAVRLATPPAPPRPARSRPSAPARGARSGSFGGGSSGFRGRDDRGDRTFRDRSSGDRPAFGSRPSFSDRPAFADRPVRTDRPAFSDRPSRPDRPSFGERSAYTDRPANSDRPARSDRPAFADRPVRTDRPAFSDRQSRPDRPAYTDRPSFGARSAYTDRPANSDRPARTDRPAFSERPVYSDRPSRPDRPAYTDRPTRTDRPAFGDRRPSAPGSDRPASRSFRETTGSDRDGGTWTPRDGGSRPDPARRPPSFADRGARPGPRDQGPRPARAWSDAAPRTTAPERVRPARSTTSVTPGAHRPRGEARFDDTAQPLNRRARRLLAFGETAGAANRSAESNG